MGDMFAVGGILSKVLDVVLLREDTRTVLEKLFNQTSLSSVFVTGYRKRAHFAQELIFQNKQLKYVTPLDCVHNSDSLNC